jgi:hypothetical protein
MSTSSDNFCRSVIFSVKVILKVLIYYCLNSGWFKCVTTVSQLKALLLENLTVVQMTKKEKLGAFSVARNFFCAIHLAHLTLIKGHFTSALLYSLQFITAT